MRILAMVRVSLVVGATLGLLIPNTALARGPVVSKQVRDVALQPGGMLQGTLLTSSGRPDVDQTVLVVAGNEVVARAVTDRDGRFTVHGMRAGVYSVRADESQGVYRLWAAGTAPPSARGELLMVTDDGRVVRGGGRFGSSKGNMLLMGGLILAAGVIGGVIGYNIQDDAS